MKKHAIALSALLAVTGTAATAADGDSHAYIGAAAGMSQMSIDCTGSTSCDKTDTGGKVVAGYKFGNGFGLEAGFMSFGKGGGADAGSSATLKPTAFTLGGVYTLPMGTAWGMNLRLGAAQVKTKVDARLGTARGSASETKTKAYAGLGLSYAISNSVKLEFAVDSTQAEFGGETGTLRLVTFGAAFAF